MTMYPRMKLLQPQPFDLVDQQVKAATNLLRPGQQLRVPIGNQI